MLYPKTFILEIYPKELLRNAYRVLSTRMFMLFIIMKNKNNSKVTVMLTKAYV